MVVRTSKTLIRRLNRPRRSWDLRLRSSSRIRRASYPPRYRLLRSAQRILISRPVALGSAEFKLWCDVSPSQVGWGSAFRIGGAPGSTWFGFFTIISVASDTCSSGTEVQGGAGKGRSSYDWEGPFIYDMSGADASILVKRRRDPSVISGLGSR